MKGKTLELSAFDWHRDVITPQTPVNAGYRNTQNVRRFMREACGPAFRFDRSFMAWMRDGTPKTMGDAAAEWLKRNA